MTLFLFCAMPQFMTKLDKENPDSAIASKAARGRSALTVTKEQFKDAVKPFSDPSKPVKIVQDIQSVLQNDIIGKAITSDQVFTNLDHFFTWIEASEVPVHFMSDHSDNVSRSLKNLEMARNGKIPAFDQVIMGCPIPRPGQDIYAPAFTSLFDKLNRIVEDIHEFDKHEIFLRGELQALNNMYHEMHTFNYKLSQPKAAYEVKSKIASMLRHHTESLEAAYLGFINKIQERRSTKYAAYKIGYQIAEMIGFIRVSAYYNTIGRHGYFASPDFNWEQASSPARNITRRYAADAILALKTFADAHYALIHSPGFLDESLYARTKGSGFYKAMDFKPFEGRYVARLIESHVKRIALSAPAVSVADRDDMHEFFDTISLYDQDLGDETNLLEVMVQQIVPKLTENLRRKPSNAAITDRCEAADFIKDRIDPAIKGVRSKQARSDISTQSWGDVRKHLSGDQQDHQMTDQMSAPMMVVIKEGFTTSQAKNIDESILNAKEMCFAEIPLYTLSRDIDCKQVLASLRRDFPHLGDIPNRLFKRLKTHNGVFFKPVLFVGGPGTNKSLFANKFCEAFGIPRSLIAMPSMNDSSFAGTPKQWNTSRMSIPLSTIVKNNVANPTLILDEIDKLNAQTMNGSPVNSLLGFLERSTAKSMQDVCLEAEVDLSRVNYIATANNIAKIDKILLDRFEVIKFPDASIEHIETLSRNILKSINEVNPEAAFGLDDIEMMVLRENWKGGSLRTLTTMIETIIDSRADLATQH